MLLEVEKLNISIGGNQIIKNLSFDIKKGEILTILGPNGSGKSVLVKALLGLIPYDGKIVWEEEISVGYLPQGLNQLKMQESPLTVLEFFDLKSTSPTLQDIEYSLKLVGLESSILSQVAGTLSGGQFQRMLLAWVLISHPNVIFLDEPTTGVDMAGDKTIYSLLYDIKKKEDITVFLITHDLNIVYKHSTSVLCLSRKGHTCFGAPKEMLDKKTLEQVFSMEIKYHKHSACPKNLSK
jgi:zinc transport system ATP-binding protein